MNNYSISILETEFLPITLSEMDGVKLMDRTDTKYTFHVSELDRILRNVSFAYKVLVIKDKRISKYETLYYDTLNHDLYLKHHNGLLNRFKIRHRTYIESEIGFLEVKFKNNKGRTIKERIKKNDVPQIWDEASENFLNSKLPFESKSLIPVVWINYKRITLVSKTTAERVTIDLDMEFIGNNNKVDLSKLVIAEVKQDNKKQSVFIDAMKHYHIREGSLSKYCMAIALVNENIRKNSFKQKLNQIKKIINYGTAASIN